MVLSRHDERVLADLRGQFPELEESARRLVEHGWPAAEAVREVVTAYLVGVMGERRRVVAQSTLSPEERLLCSKLGLAEEDYLRTRNAEATR